jgi:hypothetical protein
MIRIGLSACLLVASASAFGGCGGSSTETQGRPNAATVADQIEGTIEVSNVRCVSMPDRDRWRYRCGAMAGRGPVLLGVGVQSGEKPEIESCELPRRTAKSEVRWCAVHKREER